MAKSEDVSAYAAEREARDAEAKGEEVNGEERVSRIREALDQARADTQHARAQNGLEQPLDLDQQFQTAEQEWNQAEVAEQEYEAERQVARNEGRFMAVAEQLKQANPQAHATMTSHLAALDEVITPEQGEAFKRALTAGDPREGLAIVHRLTTPSAEMSPQEKLQYFAQLSPDQLAQTVHQARDYLRMERNISQQYEAQYQERARKVTRAPAPFRPVRGGASPPVNLDRLAAKDNPADYIKARQAQLKKDRA